MFDEETKKQLSGILEDLKNPVKIIFFKGDNEKSKETETFVKEFSTFSPHLSLVTYDITVDKEKAQEWNVFASPAVFVGLKGVGFYGTPGGYEVNSFLKSLLEVSGQIEPLSADHKAIVDAVQSPVHLYAYVSLTCPQCPQAVMNIHRLAVLNPKIKSFMVEGPAFKEYADKYGITAFPTIVVGDNKHQLVGENAKDLDQLVQLLK